MGNKIQTRDIKHSKTTAWEIDCNSLTLEEALKILNPNNYSIYRMAEKRGAYKRVVMELDNANPSEALECLERIDNTLCLNNNKGKLEFGVDTEEHTDCDSAIGMVEDIENIKQALLKAEQDRKDLELIEKVRSGKTLIFVGKGLVMMNADKYHEYLKMEEEPISKKIKKCLKEQAWDIVVKKNVDMLLIKKYDNVSDYNSAVWLSGREKLTEEEFNLLKEVLE